MTTAANIRAHSKPIEGFGLDTQDMSPLAESLLTTLHFYPRDLVADARWLMQREMNCSEKEEKGREGNGREGKGREGKEKGRE